MSKGYSELCLGCRYFKPAGTTAYIYDVCNYKFKGQAVMTLDECPNIAEPMKKAAWDYAVTRKERDAFIAGWKAHEKEKEQMGKQAREKSEIPINQKDLEQAANDWVFDNCFDCDVVGEGRAKEAYIAGAQWQKEQMMKILKEYQKKGARCVQQSIDAGEQGEATYWDGFYDACLAIEREIKEDKK